ncbi:MAG: nicotinamide-nucleotide amidohydrolase family protein [Propionibacteriales bacterium]|nr:nicotinamide-nucleotide amidohydrolase family protein [Propionibacteriales bacterium]
MPTTQCDPIVARLADRGETVAAAESLTGGLVATMITAVPGASAVFRGAVVAYATDLKGSLLGVDPDQLATDGAVHPDTARAMADGVRETCGTDWGVATTGVAGPEPQEGKPVGLVHVAVSGPAGTVEQTLRLSGNRKRIRARAARGALQLLAAQLGLSPGEGIVDADG